MNGLTNRLINDITEFIFVSDEPVKSDIIFLPGSSDPRIPEMAAEFYAKKYSRLILPSGRYGIGGGKFPGAKTKKDIYDKDYFTECEFYTDVLIKNGVPESMILRENQSMFTKDNAVLSRKVTDENNLVIKSAIICCKPFHARRCLMYYQLAFPETDIKIVPVDNSIRRDTWFLSKEGMERVLGELSRCGSQFLIEDYFYEKIVNKNLNEG